MKKLSLLFVLFACSQLGLHAEVKMPESTALELCDAYIACIQAEMSKASASQTDAETEEEQRIRRARITIASSGPQVIRVVQSVQQSLTIGQYDRALQAAQQLVQYTAVSECASLQQQLVEAISREMAEEQARTAAELEVLQKELGAVLLAAKQPEELDPYFVRIQALLANQANSRRSSQEQQALNGLSNIVASWQEYLVYLNAGDSRQAASRLSNVSGQLKALPFLPRSWVVKRQLELQGVDTNKQTVAPPYTVLSVVSAIQSPEDLAEARTKLEALREYRSVSRGVDSELRNIQNFETAIALLESGNPYLGLASMKSIHPSHADSEWVVGFRDRLSEWAIILVTPEAYAKDVEYEGLGRYIAVVAARMQAAQDWLTLWTFLKVVNGRLGINPYRGLIPGTDDDIHAIERYINAQRLEAAGELADALASYKYVLAGTGRFGPYTEAEEAIATMRKTRGEELKADEDRKAQLATASGRYVGPRSSTMGRDNEQQMIEQAVEKAVTEKLAVWMAKEQEAEKIKADQAAKTPATK